MNRTLRMMLIGVLGIFVFHAVFGVESLAAKKALIYSGPGACEEGCPQAAAAMALRNGFDPVYIGPTELTSQSTAEERSNLFKDVALWVQPGGKSRIVLQNMTDEMVDGLRNFVNGGGGYVGFCAGAFSSTRMVGTSRFTGYNIFPGRTILFDNPNGADILEIMWNGKKRHIYWEGGPYLTEIPAGKAEAVAYYSTGQIATARSAYGKGRVFITGAHPEAPQKWRDDYGMKDPDGLDFDLASEMIHWATKTAEE